MPPRTEAAPQFTKAWLMSKDLTAGPPRRWTQELGGIRWLPRLIDKTRAARAGTLGDYLYGHSPVDQALLRALGLGYRDFTAIIGDSPSDDAVLRALERDVPDGVGRARGWSRTMPRTFGVLLLLVDIDDGYLGGPLILLKGPANAVSGVFTRWLKRRFPSRALEGRSRQ